MLGEAALETGDLPRAGVRIKRSLAVSQESGDKRGEATALWWQGRLELANGNARQARTHLHNALHSLRALEMHDEVVSCLEDHAELADAAGQFALSIKLAAAAANLRSRLSLVRAPRKEQRWLAYLDKLKHAVPAGSFDADWAEGIGWETDAAIKAAAGSGPD